VGRETVRREDFAHLFDEISLKRTPRTRRIGVAAAFDQQRTWAAHFAMPQK